MRWPWLESLRPFIVIFQSCEELLSYLFCSGLQYFNWDTPCSLVDNFEINIDTGTRPRYRKWLSSCPGIANPHSHNLWSGTPNLKLFSWLWIPFFQNFVLPGTDGSESANSGILGTSHNIYIISSIQKILEFKSAFTSFKCASLEFFWRVDIRASHLQELQEFPTSP